MIKNKIAMKKTAHAKTSKKERKTNVQEKRIQVALEKFKKEQLEYLPFVPKPSNPIPPTSGDWTVTSMLCSTGK